MGREPQLGEEKEMSEYDDDSKESSPREFGDDDKGGHHQGGGDREMHKTVCSDCGQECEVPFKPTEGRPVYCRECFKKHRKPRRSYGGGGYGGGGRGRGGYGRNDY
jgi:CxxC-x17-CxxC domain-containing protein